ncbi:energy transducer TonB [Hyphomicrobium methylovorum]|nr:energy transducer TonB [Hyphomicrobium methylovorum]
MDKIADLTTAGSVHWAASTQRERNFWIALGCALLLHGSAFVGAFTSKPKYIGDPSGSEKALSVSLITEADLESQTSAVEPPKPPPGAEPRPPQEAQPPQPTPPEKQVKEQPEPPPPEPQKEPEKQEPEKAEETPTKAEQEKPDDAKPAEQVAKAEDKAAETVPEDLFTLDSENPNGLKVEEKPKPKPPQAAKTAPKKQAAQKQKRMSSLDLSTPRDMMEPSFNPGRSAAFQRPPGITRSGLNDAFARAVIRALQQTMPQLTNTYGRVTVRIFLTESGDVQEVRLLAGAKDPSLNQDVVFAARQTSYPIPPAGSNKADRTFMVTYIYD